MKRPFVAAGSAVILGLGCWASLPASAAATAHGAVCQLSGSATISPGLTTSARSQKVTLIGVTLSGCQAGTTASPGAPTSLSGTVTSAPNPVVTKASCASGNLALKATIAWSDGKSTSASISTTGIALNQAITGKVLTSTSPYIAAADQVAGDAVFQPTSTSQDCVTVPVTAVTFTGVLAAGS